MTAHEYMKKIGHSEFTREEYEKICEELNIECMTDKDILSCEYAMKFGDFCMEHYPAEHTAKMEAARLRYKSIINERTHSQEIKESQKEKLCDCGHTVADHIVMMTSKGTACPDCYDYMSQ